MALSLRRMLRVVGPTRVRIGAMSTSTDSSTDSSKYYDGMKRIPASPWTKLTQTLDRVSYEFLLEDMWRGVFIGVEVALKPKVHRESALSCMSSNFVHRPHPPLPTSAHNQLPV
jgi:hypothetical protein